MKNAQKLFKTPKILTAFRNIQYQVRYIDFLPMFSYFKILELKFTDTDFK